MFWIILIFEKGSRNMRKSFMVPFSHFVATILFFVSKGVLSSSDWPTIPQLYVNGEFIGGCDIVMQMHESGELAELLKEAK